MKNVIVTGGNSGIGKEITNSLLKNNYRVINISRNPSKFISKKNLLNFDCDVSDYRKLEKIFKKIFKKFGDVFGLINNAGINPARSDAINTSYNNFEETLATNLKGPFYCSKFFLTHKIKKKNSGVIINIGSIMGVTSDENRCAYTISKFGLTGLTKSLTADFSKKKIRNFCICPGYVETNLTKNYLNSLTKKNKSKLIEKHKLGKFGKPSDISNLVIFLIDENKSSWMTGNIIQVDGGYLL